MIKNYLVKNVVTGEILHKQIDEDFITEILEKGLELDLFEDGKYIKASGKDEESHIIEKLNQLKDAKVEYIKQKAFSLIESNYPIWKQINIMTEAKTSIIYKDMIKFISSVRDQSNDLEKLITDASTEEDINKIELSFK